MGSMSTSAEQINSRFDVHLPDHQESNGATNGAPNEIDTPLGAHPGDAPSGESRLGKPAAPMAPIMGLLLSPNLRAAIAIGFFLAYLATALT